MQAIKLLTGATPTCFRPPFGDIDDRIRAISAALGLTNILWKHDTFDTNPDMGPDDIQKNYDDFVELAAGGNFSRQGAILLAHETNNMTMQLAIDNYSKLRGAFKHIVPVGVAFNKTQPYVEPDFKFPDFATYIKTEGAPAQNTTSSSSSSSASSASATASKGSSSASSSSAAASSNPSSSVVSASSSSAAAAQSGPAKPASPASGEAPGSAPPATTASETASQPPQAPSSAANNVGGVTTVVTPTETAVVTPTPVGGVAQGADQNENGAMSLLSSSAAVTILPVFLLFFGLN
ncbi:hypothetical protein AAF712_014181 [Marasmius tenuissimus]|uniref:chitin deacetylase n=1 Tax=Marasmius tenuissimus TaxID=585030 RepID=A0ABR2ZCM9_9AGAR